MTGQELKAFTESLTDGATIEETFFYQLLNIAKAKIEAERAWRILLKEDNSNSVSTGNTFTTAHSLPADFAIERKVFLVDSDNNPVWLSPIPFEMKYAHKNSSRRYYIDLANSNIYLTGSINKAYTLIIFYSKNSTEIAFGTSWAFPSRFHGILGFMVAEMWKAGVDYDDVSVAQAMQNSKDAKLIWDAMIDWDSNLQAKAMGGQYSDHMASHDADGLPEADSFETPLGLM